MDLLPRHDFTSHTDHLTKVASLSYADLPTDNTFHCIIFLKITLVMSLLISSEKARILGSSQVYGGRYNCPKILIFI